MTYFLLGDARGIIQALYDEKKKNQLLRSVFPRIFCNSRTAEYFTIISADEQAHRTFNLKTAKPQGKQ